MKYIFMDNFRGFTNELIPISKTMFLVGENSTGKSSFLKLIHMMSNRMFWLDPVNAAFDYDDFGGFSDIVSAASNDKNSFTIGQFQCHADNETCNHNCAFDLLTYKKSEDGKPALSKYVCYRDGQLLQIILEKLPKYKVSERSIQCDLPINSEANFLGFVQELKNDNTGYTRITEKHYMDYPLALIFTTFLMEDKKEGKKFLDKFAEGISVPHSMFWLAPIRTKPKRTYDSISKDFSPEGDHTPYVIRSVTKGASKGKSIKEKLNRFGEKSGLFMNIKTHSFATSPESPFELLIELGKSELNINNVGYGVSQVLPLIMEILTRDEGEWFSIQQPEVHLHPKAQATLGELLYDCVKEKSYTCLIETHSDYLIDRFRLNIKRGKTDVDASVLFFERYNGQNRMHHLPIDLDGQYPEDQPKSFRDFFIKEELALLEI